MSLYVHFKKKLNHFTLEVAFEMEKEMIALLGASGSGKSMTLKCIAGIETPDWGVIRLDGKVFFDSERKICLPPQERQVGYLFQNYALFPHMTVAGNIGVSVPRSRRKQVVQEKIQRCQLQGLEDKYPRELSGGQQQRVALARMLAAEPEIILLDEPFSALDAHLKWQLEQEVQSLGESLQKPMILVSHHQEEVYHLCGQVAVIESGQLGALKPRRELFENPKTRLEAQLAGIKNIVEVERDGEAVVLPQWGCRWQEQLPPHIKYLGIKSEALGLSGGDEAAYEVKGKVLRKLPHQKGLCVVVSSLVDEGKEETLVWEATEEEARPYEKGDAVTLYVKKSELRYLREEGDAT
ncbi:MAG: sulfate/molybdate ABC transporter ATP-binding protein [Cellulosilyticaceae bacterium]